MKKPRALNHTNYIMSWTILGMAAGYPSCCIGEFVIRIVKHIRVEPRLLHGTGFVPCIKCNQLSEQQLINQINEFRDPILPKFPEDADDLLLKAAGFEE